MSQSVTLLSPRALTAQSLLSRAGFNEHSFVHADGPGQPSVQLSGVLNRISWHVTVSVPSAAGMFRDEYESNDDLDLEFRAVAQRLFPVLVYFNSYEAVREVVLRFLRSVANSAHEYWLDTDFGWVVRCDRLLQILEDYNDWDWRCEPAVYNELILDDNAASVSSPEDSTSDGE